MWPKENSSAQLAATQLKLVIADDSITLCDRLVNMFSEVDGVEIVGLAKDVPSADEAINRLQPDVVILDIQMPGGSGIDVLKAMKQRHDTAIAIMLTNHPYPQYRQKCLELGADYFFSKSTDAQRLLEVIGQLANSKRSLHG
ncbi:MAG TPA: response regulator transcription factor [Pyrinomonadaceae bacterium]|nr:response regulator transcription factor [Pyrinomonadaceae bacterium]